MKAYKVIQKLGNRYYSMNKGACDVLSQRYYKTRENFPKYQNSGIVCFKNLKDAINIYSLHEEIYLVEGEELEKVPEKRLEIPIDCKKEEAQTFWNTDKLEETNFQLGYWPQGTVFLKSIKFVKRILDYGDLYE